MTAIQNKPAKSKLTLGQQVGLLALVVVPLGLFVLLLNSDATQAQVQGWGFLIFVALLYFMPSFRAARTNRFLPIFALNLFLGWTLIGWIVAFVWAWSCPLRSRASSSED
jgi:Superinfection immunity protein